MQEDDNRQDDEDYIYFCKPTNLRKVTKKPQTRNISMDLNKPTSEAPQTRNISIMEPEDEGAGQFDEALLLW